MEALKLENLKIEKTELKSPPLEEVAKALSKGLAENFAEIKADVVDCPNLTLAPFNLAVEGLGGDPTVIQIGDPFYVFPNLSRDKLYDLRDVPKALGLDSAFIIGAGGGCWPTIGHFSEIIANVAVRGNHIRNFSKEAFTIDATLNGVTVANADVNESRISVIGNLYVCRGEPGKVVRVLCKRRKGGNGDFPACINSSLKKAFDYPVAVGIVIQMTCGKAEHHVLKGFPENLTSAEKAWEQFLLPQVSSPFIGLGTLLTFNPPGWGVTLQHIHSYNDRNEGGHYHYDVTPDEAEYVAYIAPAATLSCIDKSSRFINIFDFKL